MKKPITTSREWVAYFRQNAQEDAELPVATRRMGLTARSVVAASLPAWQLGETSDGRHLRAAARQYALAHHDGGFLEAVELFIREEQRHGAMLGEWLDAVGIPRRRRDLGDSLFRLCRYAIPNYALWASIVVMVESMAEIYYAAVRRATPCPLLRTQCRRILRDEVRHIQFQCEHLAAVWNNVPRRLRPALGTAEFLFYLVVCAAVWFAHGRLMRYSGLNTMEFARLALGKFRHVRRLRDPGRYDFSARFTAESSQPAAAARTTSH